MNNNEHLQLINNKIQLLLILSVLFAIFLFNIGYEYSKFKNFKKDEVFVTDATVINTYQKKHYQVLKLEAKDFTFFTSYKQKQTINKNDEINIYINTNKIAFLKYLKGFYTTSFNIQKINTTQTLKQKLSRRINNQHENGDISSLFNALFFAIPVSKEVRDVCSNFAVSHLVALSGLHIGILSGVIFGILYFPYSILQSKYFPYRNKKFDLLLITSVILFLYLIFTNIVPSLLRAFVMFILSIYFLRMNIKLISFQTLSLVVLIIVAIFPKLVFSLGLWFSVAGVFYIFLFIQYAKDTNKILAFILFNIWIFLAMNPIVHYFFGTTSLVQLYSPLFTIGFTLFYPIELFLHTIYLGGLFDNLIELWLNLKVNSIEVFTPTWLFYIYILISLLSMKYKVSFKLLNLSLISFNIWLYLQ